MEEIPKDSAQKGQVVEKIDGFMIVLVVVVVVMEEEEDPLMVQTLNIAILQLKMGFSQFPLTKPTAKVLANLAVIVKDNGSWYRAVRLRKEQCGWKAYTNRVFDIV